MYKEGEKANREMSEIELQRHNGALWVIMIEKQSCHLIASRFLINDDTSRYSLQKQLDPQNHNDRDFNSNRLEKLDYGYAHSQEFESCDIRIARI